MPINKGTTWLDDPALQKGHAALFRELAPFQEWKLGSYTVPDPPAVVVVFQTTFRQYDELWRRLGQLTAPLAVELRPACYPPERITEAQALIGAMNWHPRAKLLKMGGHLDPSFAGFVVTIHDSAPEVAEALVAAARAKGLEQLIRVRLGKPH